MICDILDFRCVIQNELIGNVVLTVVFGFIFYFLVASRLNLGFDATIAFSFPILLILGLAFTGFSIIYAFITVITGLLLALLFNKIIGNR